MLAGHPGTDYELDPDEITITGRLLMDRIVFDADGDDSIEEDVPVAGLVVELRHEGETEPGRGFRAITDEDGDFEITGLAMDPTTDGELVVHAKNDACWVLDHWPLGAPGGSLRPPFEGVVSSDVDLSADRAIGTVRFTDTNDAAGDLRERLNIALVIGEVRAWASARTTDTIVPVVVDYHDEDKPSVGTSVAGSTYVTTRDGHRGSRAPGRGGLWRLQPRCTGWNEALREAVGRGDRTRS